MIGSVVQVPYFGRGRITQQVGKRWRIEATFPCHMSVYRHEDEFTVVEQVQPIAVLNAQPTKLVTFLRAFDWSIGRAA